MHLVNEAYTAVFPPGKLAPVVMVIFYSTLEPVMWKNKMASSFIYEDNSLLQKCRPYFYLCDSSQAVSFPPSEKSFSSSTT